MAGSCYKWCVYMLRSKKSGVYYVGITTDLQRRLRQHNEGKGAKFTRGRGPWLAVAWDYTETKSWALKLERRLKRMTRAQKEAVERNGMSW